MSKETEATKQPETQEKEKGEKVEPKKESKLAGIRKGIIQLPPRIFLYGVHGIGKTTFASHAPAPILIPTEDGADQVDVDKFPAASSSTDVLDDLRTLYRERNEYRTVIIDSADWLEDFIQKELPDQYSDKELGYGRDALFAAQKAAEVLSALNILREKRGMSAIIIAHCETKRFDDPRTEPYDRYQPKLQKTFGALMQEWADAVLFATYDVTVKREDVGFDKKVRRGMSTGQRLVYTEERPAFYAKNRYGMPDELPLSWEEVATHIPYLQQPSAK